MSAREKTRWKQNHIMLLQLRPDCDLSLISYNRDNILFNLWQNNTSKKVHRPLKPSRLLYPIRLYNYQNLTKNFILCTFIKQKQCFCIFYCFLEFDIEMGNSILLQIPCTLQDVYSNWYLGKHYSLTVLPLLFDMVNVRGQRLALIKIYNTSTYLIPLL